MKNCMSRRLISAAFFVFLANGMTSGQTTAPTTRPVPITFNLEFSPDALDMQHLMKNEMGYMPTAIPLVEDKPAGITKEPAYQGKPMYGAFRIGNGPRCVTYFVVDETEGKPGKLYLDLNQNGDLTDDGSSDWQNTKKNDDGIVSYNSTVALHASYGTPVKEDEGGSYSVMMYKRQGDKRVGYVKVSARSGKITLGEKSYSILLVENTNDGIFTVPTKGDRTRRPVELMIDIDGDGLYKGAKVVIDGKNFFTPERFALSDPFKVNDQWWYGRPSLSGSELTLVPTAPPGEQVAKSQEPAEEKVLLTAGANAPDFTAQAPDGSPIKLSDFKGKVVILDLWATWCGPCQKSMPGLQKTYNSVKDQGVVVLSLNVFDDKDPFDSWIKKHNGTDYNFTFAYDPAGHDEKKSIAASKFGVAAIPTMYVIGRDGKIAAAIVGSGNEKKLKDVLNTQGIKTQLD